MRTISMISFGLVSAAALFVLPAVATAKPDDPADHCRRCDNPPGDIRMGRGADDAVNHDVNDNRGKDANDVVNDRGKDANDVDLNDNRGRDANEVNDNDVNDDRGVDNPANHDRNDDGPGHR